MATDALASPDVRQLVDEVLASALGERASDIHLEPGANGYEVKFRIDGMLQSRRTLEPGTGRSAVGRMMVMAKLLTYRLDVPQEGRTTFVSPQTHQSVELRVAIMPTIHGLRAAVRLPADQLQAAELDVLSLPTPVLEGLRRFAATDSGMLILTGPAGSGKTTTIYALLAEIVRKQPGLSIIALEDPVERRLAGVTQIEVSPFGQLTYERALRSILRQDPQVLVLGEIRDAATASLAIGAALSGHRLITTFHAAAPAGAISRLLEMGIEPYQLTSSLWGIVSQRLLRRRSAERGYHGRVAAAEFVSLSPAMRSAILGCADADILGRTSHSPGHQTLAQSAQALVDQGITDNSEFLRVIGPLIAN